MVVLNAWSYDSNYFPIRVIGLGFLWYPIQIQHLCICNLNTGQAGCDVCQAHAVLIKRKTHHQMEQAMTNCVKNSTLCHCEELFKNFDNYIPPGLVVVHVLRCVLFVLDL